LFQAGGDPGYVLHALLTGVFDKHVPRTFSYASAQQGLLAYTTLPPEIVAQRVALAEPEIVATLGLATSAENLGYSIRRFPTSWAVGTRLGFEVRTRPIVRRASTRKETDAFLIATSQAGDEPVDRAATYLTWLQNQLAPTDQNAPQSWHGAVAIVHAEVRQFQVLEVLRRTQSTPDSDARKNLPVSGPAVTFLGTLEVLDTDAFAELIQRGIGRHRSFGFGMLLLRPAD
jgi:CRISPR system Cascade subunit CasE